MRGNGLGSRQDRCENRAVGYVIAQVNIGRLAAPLDSARLAGFVAQLDPVNAAADAAPGFLWRLQTEDGNATALRGFEADARGAGGGLLINMSVWETVEALAAYVYGDAHRAVLRRRREWFERMTDAYTALWWIPRGHLPSVAEAEDRVGHLRAHGPSPRAFTLREHFPPPGAGGAARLHAGGPGSAEPGRVSGSGTAQQPPEGAGQAVVVAGDVVGRRGDAQVARTAEGNRGDLDPLP